MSCIIKFFIFCLLTINSVAFADAQLNLSPGVTPVSHDIYQLHMTIFWICVAIGIGVFSVMLYAIVNHRKSRGVKPAEFHEHLWLEILWSIIPFIILIVMAVPATKVLVNMGNSEHEDLTIKITGYQWKWHYEYLEDAISFYSNLSTPYDQMFQAAPKGEHYLREVDHPIVVPIHKKVRFLLTSNDVTHAWWVPDIGVKKDAVPGFINEAWARIEKPGIYYGQCAELCGMNHAYMPIVVIATTEEQYKDWINQQKGVQGPGEDIAKQWTMKELMQRGEQVYTRVCAACHQPNGAGMPPTFPALKGSPIATGPIKDHIDRVLNGKSGTAMQAFKEQLSAVELAAVITYERNAFGNNTNTTVQPIEMEAAKQGKSIAEVKTAAKGAAKAAAKNLTTTSAKLLPVGNDEVTKPKPATGTAFPVGATGAAVPAPAEASPATVSAEPKKLLKEELMQLGEKTYLNRCAMCHQANGAGMPPTFPALKGSKITVGPVADHIDRVLNGKAGTAMQAFRDQLTDEELAAVITYERNAWENNTNTLVQPNDIAAAKKLPAQTSAK